MSIGSALWSAVSALQAQSQQLAIISNNLANASTTGYKSVNAAFANLVSGTSSSNAAATGGVIASARQNVYAKGVIQPTGISTNVAIDGNGFFVVTYNNDVSQTYFTRDGNFDTDDQGFLTNNGYYLMGWPTDKNGNATSFDVNSTAGLQAINVNRFTTMAAATTKLSLQANLPADADGGDSFTTSMSVYDSLGVAQSIPVTWTKSDTNANEWTMTIGDPTDPSTGEQTGTIGGNTSYTVSFNSDGSLNSITDAAGDAVDAPTITIASWGDGAAPTPITLSMGTSGKVDGISQFASGSSDPDVDVKRIDKDGVAYGRLTGVDISDDGIVSAVYDNGQQLPIYKIPIATFPNGNGLAIMSNNVYQMTSDSGTYTLHTGGEGGAGKIDGGSLESSNVSTADQMSLMIVAQQNYAAASQVITTSNTMFNDLIQAVR
jgi:flagellar hook protein FlgE